MKTFESYTKSKEKENRFLEIMDFNSLLEISPFILL